MDNYWKIINLSLMILSVPAGILLILISRKRDKCVAVDKDKIASISMRIFAYLIDLVICANIGYFIYKYSFYIQHDISIFIYCLHLGGLKPPAFSWQLQHMLFTMSHERISSW